MLCVFRQHRSKCEILVPSRCFPFCPRQQTCGDCTAITVSCQTRKSHLPLISHHSLTGVSRCGVGDLAFEGGGKPSVHSFHLDQCGGQDRVGGLCRSINVAFGF